MSQFSPLAGTGIVAWVRDAQGNPVQLRRDGVTDASGRQYLQLSDGRAHQRMIRDERNTGRFRRPGPVHSILRDVVGKDSLSSELRVHVPEAAAIIDDYARGAFATKQDVLAAEERYFGHIMGWSERYLSGNRRDADGLFLQLETVASLGKMIEITYATPTIEDAFPITILNTVLLTARAIEKELVEEEAAIGGDVGVHGAPHAEVRRGERMYNLLPVYAGATITDEERERFMEIARDNREAFGFDLWAERLRGASLAVQRRIGRIIAFGRPQNQIPGLFRGANIPTQVTNFTSTTPADNLAAVNQLLINQFVAVSERADKMADSLALSPSSFMLLSQQIFNGTNSSNVFTMEMIMRANPQIKTVYQIREAKPNAVDAQKLVDLYDYDPTEAAINSGGIRVAGTQRNAIVAYRRDPNLVEILKGYNLETVVYPPVYNEQKARVRESTAGLVVYEPQTIRIGYEEP